MCLDSRAKQQVSPWVIGCDYSDIVGNRIMPILSRAASGTGPFYLRDSPLLAYSFGAVMVSEQSLPVLSFATYDVMYFRTLRIETVMNVCILY